MAGSIILVGGIYRRPKAPVEYKIELHEFLCENVNEKTRLILAGDFNLPGMKWVHLRHGMTEVDSSEHLLQNALSFSLTQEITEPMRICRTASSFLGGM